MVVQNTLKNNEFYLIPGMLNYPKDTGGWQSYLSIYKKCKDFKSSKENFSKYAKPLIEKKIVLIEEFKYLDCRNREHKRKLYKLNPKAFTKLFSLFYEKGMHTELIFSDYFRDNQNEFKKIIDDWINTFCFLKNLPEQELSLRWLKKDKPDIMICTYAEFFNLFLENKKRFVKVIGTVFKDIGEAYFIRNKRSYADLLFSALLIGQMIKCRYYEKNELIPVLQSELKQHLSKFILSAYCEGAIDQSVHTHKTIKTKPGGGRV